MSRIPSSHRWRRRADSVYSAITLLLIFPVGGYFLDLERSCMYIFTIMSRFVIEDAAHYRNHSNYRTILTLVIHFCMCFVAVLDVHCFLYTSVHIPLYRSDLYQTITTLSTSLRFRSRVISVTSGIVFFYKSKFVTISTCDLVFSV